METVTRKRIEILADAPLVPRVIAALKQAGIRGHTLLPALSGTGRSGDWSEERLTGSTKQIVLALASEANAQTFVDLAGPLLDSHHLLLTIMDVSVVRGDRF
jgi:PII-like signaling protein